MVSLISEGVYFREWAPRQVLSLKIFIAMKYRHLNPDNTTLSMLDWAFDASVAHMLSLGLTITIDPMDSFSKF